MDFKFIDLNPNEALKYTQSIIDAMREALIILDEERIVKAVNRAFYDITGLSADAVLNKSLYELNDGRWNVAYLDARLDAAFAERSSFKDVEIEIRVPDEGLRTVLVNGRLHSYENANHGPMVLLAVQDITDLKETRRAFRQLQQDLEDRVQQRTDELASVNAELEAFAYSVSHDLRAPLRALSGFSRALEEDYEEVLDNEGKRYLQFIQEGAQQMSRLIDDMLELSRLTRSEMKYSSVDLSATARAVIQELSDAEPDRDLTFSVDDGLVVLGDDVLLTAVLRNLIGNAWKYTSRTPHAVVSFKSETISGEPGYVVRDNGVGFDMRYVDKLFQPFQRLHSATEFEGNGIGLASAYRIVRRHGGKMWAEGSVGEGAAFFFTLGCAN